MPNDAALPHFITGDYAKRRTFLEDREYGLALDALAKACSDVLPLSSDGRSALLGRRKVEPQPDWWFIGGRARPGDTTREAAARNVKRELGLDLDVGRFEVVGTYGMVWEMRQQAPVTNGTADISTVHVLRLTKEEEKAVQLDPDEYAESGYVPLDTILECKDYHPCLKQAVRDLKKKRALDVLLEATDAYDEGGETYKGVVVAAALGFAKAQRAAAVEGEGVTKVRFKGGRYEYVDVEKEKEVEQQQGEGTAPTPCAAAEGGGSERSSSVLSEEMEGAAA